MNKIQTSQRNWFKRLAIAYRHRMAVTVIDDAKIGFDPRIESLFAIGKRADLTVAEWLGAAVAVGTGAAGLWMIRLAIVDPEPTSKLGALVLGGVACVFTGTATATWILTNRKPPSVEIAPGGIRISWV